MKTTEHSKQARHKIVEKYRSELGYKKFPNFKYPTERHKIHYNKTERIWHHHKPNQRWLPNKVLIKDARKTPRLHQDLQRPTEMGESDHFMALWPEKKPFMNIINKRARLEFDQQQKVRSSPSSRTVTLSCHRYTGKV